MSDIVGNGVALGLAQGVDQFLQSFSQGRALKEQRKMMKLAPVLDVIIANTKNPNLSLKERIKAIDAIKPMLGLKSDIPLSMELGLDKLADQDVDTGETQFAGMRLRKGTVGKASENVEDPNAVSFNAAQVSAPKEEGYDGLLQNTQDTMATNINTRDTQSTSDINEPTTKKVIRKRGDMTDNEIELLQRKSLVQSQQNDEFERQYKIALVNSDLQSRTLAQQGWKNNGDWNYDEKSKTWQQTWFNPITKENYEQKLQPGVVPQDVILKNIQYGGKTGASKAYMDLTRSVATSMGKDEDDPDVKVATANIWKNNFVAGTVNKINTATGGTPITPQQGVTNDFERLKIQQGHDQLVAQVSASQDSINALKRNRETAKQNVESTKKDFDDAKDNYDSDEKEYQVAQTAYNHALDRYNELDADYEKAVKTHGTLTKQVESSGANLQKAGISTGSGSVGSNYSARVRIGIQKIRNDPKNKGKVENLTDDQIAAQIKAAHPDW